ncbi:MAG: S8 family serine peptidase [Planctomycetota bacterium]|nr:S8 family serine peptidase [Planctomycetota bacterium]
MLFLPALLLFTLPQQSLDGQLPKQDLGVAAFLAAHPEYDGRGIRVAVLDTGIDPGHPFLQKTPDGRRKLVDWYDATTDGRMNTSMVVDLDGNGKTIGLSGRELDLGHHKSGGEVHLGRIGAEFLPAGLSGRMNAQRQAKWQVEADKYQEAVTRLEGNGTSIDEESASESETQRHFDSFTDPGVVYDVVVFERGGKWKVVIDSDEDGDLDEETALGTFRETGDWATLGDSSNMNYAVSVADDGNLTTLLFDTHGHGTHVAGIIGSYEGPNGRLNGIAPGVELVAIKIGDGKFGGSTSGFAVAKALDMAVEAGCQIANMSFGGPSFYADGDEPDSWVIDEAAKRGLILVTSAGNEGPALTTVGSPGTTESAFSIAAGVWPNTQKVNYGSLNPSQPVLFDFSSRGPLPNGDIGVDFTAPGAALSALPSWTLSKGENWNGTSMAAPQMAGCVALLRCAATQEGLAQSPARIYRAFRLAAEKLPQHDWVEVGHGAIDMERSLVALRNLAEGPAGEQSFTVSINNPFGVGEGIYLRGLPSKEPFERRINITPDFALEDSNASRSDFLRTFRLVSESTWVQVPDAMYTSSQGSGFNARINPESLEHGLYSTRILAYDDSKPENAGPDLVIPVTVVVPMEVNELGEAWNQFELGPGDLGRTFLQVPHGANVVHLRVTQNGGGENEFRTGAGSVSGFLYAGDRQRRGRMILSDNESYETTIPVEAGTVLEYAMGARWSTNVKAEVGLHFRFEGVQPQYAEFEVPAGQETGFFGFASYLRDADGLSVSASIDGVASPVVADMKIIEDPIRSTIMGGHGMFQGIVEWDAEVPEGTSKVSMFTPRSIQTTEWREDLALEIFDEADAIFGRFIAFETETDLGNMPAGKYHFRLSYPSLGAAALEARFAGAELRFYNSPGSMTLYPDLKSAISETGASSRLSIPFGGARSSFARMPELESLDDGQRYFGSVSVKSGSNTLVTVPLSIDRPTAPLTGPKDWAVTAAEEPCEEHASWVEAKASGSEKPVAWISAARDWASAEPLNFEATLAVYEALVNAGLPDIAKRDAVGFLASFPNRVEEFRAAAKSWN